MPFFVKKNERSMVNGREEKMERKTKSKQSSYKYDKVICKSHKKKKQQQIFIILYYDCYDSLEKRAVLYVCDNGHFSCRRCFCCESSGTNNNKNRFHTFYRIRYCSVMMNSKVLNLKVSDRTTSQVY